MSVYDDKGDPMGVAPGIGGTAVVEFTHRVAKTQKPIFAPTPLRGGAPKAMQPASIPGPMLTLPELAPPPSDHGGVLRAPSLGTLRRGQTGQFLGDCKSSCPFFYGTYLLLVELTCGK